MEDMEKRTEETETGEVEMTQRMAERAGWIDTQTYWYLMQLLELNVDQAQKRFPWDIEILRKVFDSTIAILRGYGHAAVSYTHLAQEIIPYLPSGVAESKLIHQGTELLFIVSFIHTAAPYPASWLTRISKSASMLPSLTMMLSFPPLMIFSPVSTTASSILEMSLSFSINSS